MVELRFENAYLLWDRAGAVANSLRGRFIKIEQKEARPGQIAFELDHRFLFRVTLNRITLMDFAPGSNFDENAEPMDALIRETLDHLKVDTLTRVGTRVFYHSTQPTLEKVATLLSEIRLAPQVTERFFDVEPSKRYLHRVYFNVEDDDLGYWFRLYGEERTAEIDLSVDVRNRFPKLDQLRQSKR